jgi:nucleotide-binding universal stress UspA family protein
LYHQPRAEFTATFVGGGNVLVGRREGDRIRLGQIALPIPPDAPPHDEGAPMRILFRPETAVAQPDPFTHNDSAAAIHTLGTGVIQERTFTGPMQRLTVAVEALRGTRQLVPEPIYGQRLTRVEVSQPSQMTGAERLAVGQQVWLGASRFHVLHPTGLKLLIYADRSPAGANAAAFGCLLAQAAGGPATLLALAQNGDEATAVNQRLNQAALSWLPRLPQLETRARLGGPEEIWREAQEGDYEIVVMGHGLEEGDEGRLAAVVRHLLFNLGVSVLFAVHPRRQVKRVLICTAAGEPGKRDVAVGGRVARRVGAEATVLHILRPDVDADGRERAERHLQAAQRTLTALGVRSQTMTRPGEPLAEMLRVAAEEACDLLVIGAPTPPAPQRLVWPEFTGQVALGAPCPVLVVPMQE